jgi:hypothetical protein
MIGVSLPLIAAIIVGITGFIIGTVIKYNAPKIKDKLKAWTGKMFKNQTEETPILSSMVRTFVSASAETAGQNSALLALASIINGALIGAVGPELGLDGEQINRAADISGTAAGMASNMGAGGINAGIAGSVGAVAEMAGASGNGERTVSEVANPIARGTALGAGLQQGMSYLEPIARPMAEMIPGGGAVYDALRMTAPALGGALGAAYPERVNAAYENTPDAYTVGLRTVGMSAWAMQRVRAIDMGANIVTRSVRGFFNEASSFIQERSSALMRRLIPLST